MKRAGVVVSAEPRYKVGLVLVNDTRMRQLKKTFWGRAQESDVVSFPLGEVDPEDGVYFLGEVVVNLDQARRQARQYRVSLRQELARLITHGALHLLGSDDATKQSQKKMKQEENRVLLSLETPRRGVSTRS